MWLSLSALKKKQSKFKLSFIYEAKKPLFYGQLTDITLPLWSSISVRNE